MENKKSCIDAHPEQIETGAHDHLFACFSCNRSLLCRTGHKILPGALVAVF